MSPSPHWPPNHKAVTVTVAGVATDVQAATAVAQVLVPHDRGRAAGKEPAGSID